MTESAADAMKDRLMKYLAEKELPALVAKFSAKKWAWTDLFGYTKDDWEKEDKDMGRAIYNFIHRECLVVVAAF
jgi:hypothetical protein